MSDLSECPICSGPLRAVSVEREVSIGTRATRVLDEFFRCATCGEEVYLPGQMDATLHRASAKIRVEEGLLLPEEIRSIRESLGLTQSALEELLGVGPKTVVRWEKGTVFQNGATDSLLRTIRDVPRAAEYLAGLHGVALGSLT